MSGIRHLGIVVSDLNKMIEFYKLLGFEEFITTNVNGKLIDELIGINNTDVKIVKLKSKDNSIIELLKYNNEIYPRDKHKLYDEGISHLAITVDNIDEIYKTLKSVGIKFISKPLLTKDNVRVCFCRDFEYNYVEIVEEIKIINNSSYINVVYDQDSHPPSKYPQELINYLVDRFDIKIGSKILDCGCGNKFFLNAFKNAGMNAIGIDLNNNGDLSIFEADFEKDRLPFEDNSFQVCFSKSIIEHLNSPENYLKEIYRVLAPGGRLILMTPDWKTTYKIFFTDYTHKQPYSVEAVDDLLKIFGFRDVQTQLLYQLPMVWKYPFLKIVCRFLQLILGVPNKIEKNGFVRWSREKMCLGVGKKE